MNTGFDSVVGVTEAGQHLRLLTTATTRIEELGGEPPEAAAEQLSEWLDWFAFLTREHFGLQLRLLNESRQQSEYLRDRVEVHGRFRRRLTALYIDALKQECSVLERFRAMCYELLDDMQAQHTIISELVCNVSVTPRPH